MSKLTTQTLMLAANQIGKKSPGNEVTAIQFEDGSGYKYNFQLNGDAPWHYIDLGKEFIDSILLADEGYESAIRSKESDAIQHAFKHKLALLDDKMAQDFMHMLIMLKMK